MAREVKKSLGKGGKTARVSRNRAGKTAVPRNRAGRTTRISRKHQVTIPAFAFRLAGLEPGDTLQAEALGAGRVVLTRVDEVVDRYSGALDTDGGLRTAVEGLREEWR